MWLTFPDLKAGTYPFGFDWDQSIFASVAILEDVARIRRGNVVGAPEQLLKLADTPDQMSNAQLEVQGVHCGSLVTVKCRVMREDMWEVALWLIVAGHDMCSEES